MDTPTLLGRDRELALLHGLIAGVGERGGALVVRGEAGIGKSALLAAASRRARAQGVRVLSVSGVQSEAHLSFAGLHQLLRPILTGAETLPPRLRGALEAAFGLGDTAASDLFLVALAVLELLADAAIRAPIVIVAEDVQWLDHPTRDLLVFISRRVDSEPILILFALRDGIASPLDAIGLPELQLAGLDNAAAGALLDTHSPGLDLVVRERLLDEAAGNPLALAELPAALRSAQLRGQVALPAWLPLTTRLERAFAARVADLPDATRALLLVAAIDDGGVLAEVLAASAAFTATPVALEMLDPAVAARLIEVEGHELRFRHPLMRSAIYQAASVSRRRAAHAALASVLIDQPDRCVWHQAAATTGTDVAVSAALAAMAGRAWSRGAIAVAAAALERAAMLTDDQGTRGQRLIAAAMHVLDLGQHEAGIRLMQAAQPLALDRAERAQLAWLQEIFTEQGKWSGTANVPIFVELADEAREAGQPNLALSRLLSVVLRCWWANPDQQTRDLVVAAAERIPVPGNHPVLLTILAEADPVERGALVLERFPEHLPPAGADSYAITLMLGLAATAVGDYARASTWLATAVAGLRVNGRLRRVGEAMVSQSWTAYFLGAWDDGLSTANEAVRLEVEFRQPLWAATAQLAEATMRGACGHIEEAEALAAAAERVMLPMGAHPMLSLVQLARGVAALGAGRYEDAYLHLRRIFDPADIAYHPFVRSWAIADLAEAASHCGHLEEARTYAAELVPILAKAKWPVLRASLGYALPLLADDDEAEALFRANLAADAGLWTFFRARLHLAYGVWLRRQRRVNESRVPLREAREALDALGAAPWAERARVELRAAGETSQRRAPAARDELTPQELQIAQLAAQGLSNREIGQHLYLSHRTISTHLYRVFPKLGITTRSELRSALNAEGSLTA